jgi:hypothetical protein
VTAVIAVAILAASLIIAGAIAGTIFYIGEKIMSSATPGLTALQALVPTLQSFATQMSTDLASLNTNVTAAITALGSSAAAEDPQVLAAVQSLQSALATVQANESTLETLNTNLGAAVAPSPAPSTPAAAVKE